MEDFTAILAISAPLDCFQFDCDSSGLKICGKNKKKPVETEVSTGFGGDKRDRTADLLNAMAKQWGKPLENRTFAGLNFRTKNAL